MTVDVEDRTARILLVGDETERGLLAETLRHWDRPHQIAAVLGLDEALQRVDTSSYDVLFVAEVLSPQDRLEVVQQARTSREAVCIIAVFGEDSGVSVTDALAAGADDVLRNSAPSHALGPLLERRLEAVAWRERYEQIHGRYRDIVDNMPAAMASIAPDGTVTYASGPTEELLGASPEALVGRVVGNLTGPQKSTPQLRRALEAARETGETQSLVLPREHPDGRVMWWRLSVSPRGGVPAGEVVAVGQDITEQIEATTEAQRRTGELNCLYAVTHALHGTLDAREAIQAATDALHATHLADAVSIMLLDDDGKHVSEVTSAGFSPAFRRAAGQTLDLILEAGLFSHALRSGSSVRMDAENFSGLTIHTDLLRDQDLADGVCVPVWIGSRIAALLVVMRRERPYDDDEIELIESIAEHVATTAEMARAHNEVRRALRSGNRLLEVSAAINAEEEMSQILNAICTAAVAGPGAIRSALMVSDPGGAGPSFTCASAAGDRAARQDDAYDALIDLGLRVDPSEHSRLFLHRESADWPLPDEEDDVRSAVVLPLVFAGETLGVLTVRHDRSGSLTRQDWLALELLASKAALTIHSHALLNRVQESEKLYRDLFELSGVPMIVYNSQGAIEMVNQAFERLTGYKREQLLSDFSVFDLIDEADREQMREDHTRYWAGEKQLQPNRQFRGLIRNGEQRFIEAALHRMPGREQVTAVLIDRTEPRQLQRQLIQSEKAAALGQLVSGIAHELNNPLTTILGYSQLLQDHSDDSVVEDAGLIEREARRSQRIIEGLLSFARERPVDFSPTDVNDAVREAVRMPEYAMKVDNIAIDLDLADDLPIISADPHQLVQVFLNLITNAHFAMRETGGWLSISSRLKGGAIEVRLSDDGPGMNEVQASRAFDPFFTTKSVNEGTGLGLSVSEGIVRRHNGSISLETSEGEGATFTVRLPVQAVPEADEGQDRGKPVETDSLRVLVVDDERPLLELVHKALTAFGHKVDAVSNATRALDLLDERSYDVVLSDLRMPGMDGESFHAHVLERWPRLADRFVLVTGDTVAVESGVLSQYEGTRVICKPFTLQQLRDLVTEVAGGTGRD
ncbi:MAG: PAS domain S-box protein [Armatimonadia bacterium]|nr:PAS domain S-box protein [Armatimonadia bacterium]